jgi:ribonuclease BN (tRNA processing enzyme)
MELTILGSGTVVPDGKRNSAGYFVELPDASMMMDCGAGTVHALARYGLPWQRMSHLFISHFHVDHIGEIASLFFAFKWGMEAGRSEPLTLIGPHGLDRVLEKLDEALGPRLFEPRFPVSLKMLAPNERIEAGRATVSVARTPHTSESLAIRIDSDGRSLCYTGDTDYSDDLIDFFKESDVLVSECSFRYRKQGVPHLSIQDVSRMAARARVARLVVTHFYFPVDDEELKSQLGAEYSGEVIVGRDGMKLVI